MQRPLVMLIALVLCLLPMSASAQTDGTLVSGQPTVASIEAADAPLLYEYTLAAPRLVTLQAISENVPPTLSITQNGEVIAAETNAEVSRAITLSAPLTSGSYTVEVGTADGTTGMVILLVQSEVPIAEISLVLETVVSGEVNPETPIALYNFDAPPEGALLYIDASSGGASFTLSNLTSGRVSGLIGADLNGGMFRIPASGARYTLEVRGSGTTAPFSLCLTVVGNCGNGETVVETPPPVEATIPVFTTACSITPNASSVNIRQSANVASPVVGALPGNATVTVIGIAPTRDFYNIVYNITNGWVAASVVTTSGDCGNLPIINPPPFALPTATPPPPTPVPPTPIPPTVTPSGPCLITMTGEALVYTRPEALPDYIQDEVQPGFELIPVGRLADNSWWRTNYANAWIQTSLFGSAARVTGDCSGLPIVAPN